jgi:tRNA dimethylallyltransferase
MIVPFIVGPTAVGKTRLSAGIAERLDVEIVSADSRQLYRMLDIGTSKPPKELLRKVPHHLINFLRPDEDFSAGMYSQVARKVIDQIAGRDRIPLVVGGSGLYIRALIDGLHTVDVREDRIRISLRNRLIKEGVKKLYGELKQIDPVLAEKIEPTDKQRIIRGLEVYLSTGKRLSEIQEQETDPAEFEPLIFGLKAEREWLYNVINARVLDMFDQGFLAEAANLKLNGFSRELNSLNTVGYKELFIYLENKISFDEMIEMIQRNTRHYAKRQMTWFRRDKRIHWIGIDANTDFSKLADEISAKIKSKI